MSYEFDVTVIGGGPGGYAAAVLAGRAGKKTCLVENGQLGGTCLNVGCIPTKVMVKTAELLEQFRRAPSFSIGGSGDAFVDMDALQKRKKAVTGQLVGGVRALLKGAGVTVINGKAEFADPHTVRVDGGKTVTSEYFIVATGSETVIPRSVVYDEDCHMMTSTELLDIRTVPQSLAVLGGGVIVQRFGDLIRGRRSTPSRMEDSFITPTLNATPGDLSLVLPKRILDGIIEMIYALDKIAPGTANDDTLLYGVEVKFYNMEVALDEHLETAHRGLYVIGDGSGITHSLSHASASGVFVARDILAQNAG